MRPFFAAAVERGPPRRRADRVDDDVDAPLARQLADLLADVDLPVVERDVGAELQRPLELLLAPRGDDHERGPREPRDLEREGRDAAADAVDQDALAGPERRARQEHPPGRHRGEREGGRLLVRQVGRRLPDVLAAGRRSARPASRSGARRGSRSRRRGSVRRPGRTRSARRRAPGCRTTRSPMARPVTPAPSASTRPQPSAPGTCGNAIGTPGHPVPDEDVEAVERRRREADEDLARTGDGVRAGLPIERASFPPWRDRRTAFISPPSRGNSRLRCRACRSCRPSPPPPTPRRSARPAGSAAGTSLSGSTAP